MSQNIGVKKSSAALKVKGKDSYRFLSGMLTQDVQKNSFPNGGRSFFLTNKGKIICPLYFVCLNEEEVCLWTDESDIEQLHQSLNKFLIADQVELLPMGNFTSWTLLESDYTISLLPTKNAVGQEKIFTAFIDENKYVLPQAQLSSTHVEVLCLKNENNFEVEQPLNNLQLQSAFVKAGQPLWGVDLVHDDFFLEFPLAETVSFDKGCYIGQETVARGTFRGKVNKCYSHFKSLSALAPGDLHLESGEKIGTIRAVTDGIGTGLASLKIESQTDCVLNGEKIQLEIKHLVNEQTFRKGR